jgi:SHS2 domain-containing protein
MYELFEHTADLGLRVTAPTLDALFADAARGLAAMIVERPEAVRPEVEERFDIAGTDREFLLFDWLRELLYRFDADKRVFADFAVTVTDAGLTATARGEPLDPARHGRSHEVKAITYHELKVEPTADGWLAEVIVDI